MNRLQWIMASFWGFTFGIVYSAFAGDTIVYQSDKPFLRIKSEKCPVYAWVDEKGNTTIDAIEALDSAFVPYELPNFYENGGEFKVTWLKFTIKNTTTRQPFFILQDPYVYYCALYFRQNGKWIKQEAGRSVAERDKKIPYHNNWFELNLSTDESKTFYLRLASKHNFAYHLGLVDTSFLVKDITGEWLFTGMYLGVGCVILLVSLGLWGYFRQEIYGWYALYILASIWFGQPSSFIQQLLIPNHPEWIDAFILRKGHYFLFISALFMFVFKYIKYSHFQKKNGTFVAAVMVIYLVGSLVEEFFLGNSRWVHHAIVLPYAGLLWQLQSKKQTLNVSLKWIRWGLWVNFVFLCINLMAGLKWIPFLQWWVIRGFLLSMFIEAVLFLIGIVMEMRRVELERHAKTVEKLKLEQKLNQEMKARQTLAEQYQQELEVKVLDKTNDLKVAYEEIARMNQLLSEENQSLVSNVAQLRLERVENKRMSWEEFCSIYPTEEACMEQLIDMKWGKPYACRRCGNEGWGAGNSPHSRRCKKCKYIESATAYTLFHGIHFSVQKALYILYLVANSKDKVNFTHLSKVLEMRINTCYDFGHRCEEICQSVPKNKKPENWMGYIFESGKNA